MHSTSKLLIFFTISFKYYFFISFYYFFVFIFYILSTSWSHCLSLPLFLNPAILLTASHQPPQFQRSETHAELLANDPRQSPSTPMPTPVRDPQTHEVTKSNHPAEIKTQNPDPWNQTTEPRPSQEGKPLKKNSLDQLSLHSLQWSSGIIQASFLHVPCSQNPLVYCLLGFQGKRCKHQLLWGHHQTHSEPPWSFMPI